MSRNVKKAGKSVQNAGKTIESAGSSMTKAITLPVAGMGVAAVKTAADFEAGMSNVGAIMGTVSKKDIPDAIKAANDMHLSFKKGGNATETARHNGSTSKKLRCNDSMERTRSIASYAIHRYGGLESSG